MLFWEALQKWFSVNGGDKFFLQQDLDEEKVRKPSKNEQTETFYVVFVIIRQSSVDLRWFYLAA